MEGYCGKGTKLVSNLASSTRPLPFFFSANFQRDGGTLPSFFGPFLKWSMHPTLSYNFLFSDVYDAKPFRCENSSIAKTLPLQILSKQETNEQQQSNLTRLDFDLTSPKPDLTNR